MKKKPFLQTIYMILWNAMLYKNSLNTAWIVHNLNVPYTRPDNIIKPLFYCNNFYFFKFKSSD